VEKIASKNKVLLETSDGEADHRQPTEEKQNRSKEGRGRLPANPVLKMFDKKELLPVEKKTLPRRRGKLDHRRRSVKVPSAL